MADISIIQLGAWYGVFLFSVTLHEAAHAWAAMHFGDYTAHGGGQVTLNPLPHIQRSPFGMVVVPLASLFLMGWPFGYASAPYDPAWARKHHRKAALMALAGPASNFTVVLFAVLAMRLGLMFGLFTMPGEFGFATLVAGTASTGAFAMLISQLFTMNLVLTTLNLLPVPPLDGSEIINLLLNARQAEKFSTLIRNPSFGIIGLIIAWNIFPHVFNIAFSIIFPLIYP
jgi:Zn-dependent protease